MSPKKEQTVILTQKEFLAKLRASFFEGARRAELLRGGLSEGLLNYLWNNSVTKINAEERAANVTAK